ncbi:hypothetical protein KFL_000670400 [Klebsormidium nitens]|uniref:Uncharacterized protein n=1 Tax=Klebsormidium nitens TaxID=105231 RepID=A0A1Y1HS96_KLENI|nr:hypothetical protein KFL_000670400 [Klebsormidium nitens]|eukprot:GAQ80983.1 hypothetical protein KFL_000670400 [Klebsormidium nitens]
MAYLKAFYAGAGETASTDRGGETGDVRGGVGEGGVGEGGTNEGEAAARVFGQGVAARARAQQMAAGVRPEVQGGRFRFARSGGFGGEARSEGRNGGGKRPEEVNRAGEPSTSGRGEVERGARTGQRRPENRTEESGRQRAEATEPVTDGEGERNEEDPGRIYREGGYPWPQTLTGVPASHACQVCKSAGNPSKMLLCDYCLACGYAQGAEKRRRSRCDSLWPREPQWQRVGGKWIGPVE